MPLYEHQSGEKVRTVLESPEDDRLREDPAWTRQDDTKTEGRQADATRAPAKTAAARGAVTAGTTNGGDQ